MKAQIFSVILTVALPLTMLGQNVGISDSDSTFTPDNSAALEIKSTSRGVLVPRLTTTQRDAISSPAEGLLVYDTSLDYLFYYNAGWNQLGGVSGSAGSSLDDADADTRIEVENTADEDKIRMTTKGVERMSIDTAGKVIIGSTADHTYFIKDGSLRMEGEATTFTDLNVPVNATKSDGAKMPSFKMFLEDGGGQGVLAYGFESGKEEELFFMVQMPHSWKEGSDIYPHVHWSVQDDLGSSVVRWGLEYTWSNVGSTFSQPSIIYGTTPIGAASPVTANLHTITPFGALDATGKNLSSVILCRVFRDGDNSGDTFNHDAFLLMIDFHFEEDSFGSRTEYTK
jgi:hypothetical protein